MTPLVLVLLSLAGGVGAALRLVVDGLVRQAVGARFPWGTALINVSGSLALGVVTGAAAGPLPEAWSLVLGTGLLGGWTTFSTASFETVRLLQERRRAAAALNAGGVLVLAVAAAALGYPVGRAL